MHRHSRDQSDKDKLISLETSTHAGELKFGTETRKAIADEKVAENERERRKNVKYDENPIVTIYCLANQQIHPSMRSHPPS